jgi:hypothetical protein
MELARAGVRRRRDGEARAQRGGQPDPHGRSTPRSAREFHESPVSLASNAKHRLLGGLDLLDVGQRRRVDLLVSSREATRARATACLGCSGSDKTRDAFSFLHSALTPWPLQPSAEVMRRAGYYRVVFIPD